MNRVAGSILIILLVFFLAAGCTSKEITRQDVIGKYVANYNKDKVSVDSIEVKADGTYIHYFKSAQDGAAFTDTGTWKFDYWKDTPQLNLVNFTFRYEEPEGYIAKNGVWAATVQDEGNRLLINDDLGLHYDKQK